MIKAKFVRSGHGRGGLFIDDVLIPGVSAFSYEECAGDISKLTVTFHISEFITEYRELPEDAFARKIKALMAQED